MKTKRTKKRRQSKRASRNKRTSRKSKRRIEHRLRLIDWEDQPKPMFSGTGVEYEVSDRIRAFGAGGIGLIHRMVHSLGLPEAIDSRLELLKVHLPYHESDHVLNIA